MTLFECILLLFNENISQVKGWERLMPVSYIINSNVVKREESKNILSKISLKEHAQEFRSKMFILFTIFSDTRFILINKYNV